MTRSDLSQRLVKAPWILQGTLVERRLRCRRERCSVCREHGGHGPFFYLSRRGKAGRTEMVYVPRACVGEVRAAVRAFARLKEGLGRVRRRT
jgi:hypothetical protein